MPEQWHSPEDQPTGPPPEIAGDVARPSEAVRLSVFTHSDVTRARSEARFLARSLGFSREQTEKVVLAVSELATNLVRHAQWGELVLAPVTGPQGAGTQVESRDRGPGIPDLDRAMQNGYSTGRGLGIGLPGVRRLMDEFTISTGPAGTTVVARKWARAARQ